MNTKLLGATASVLILAGCSGMQANEPTKGTVGDETNIAEHHIGTTHASGIEGMTASAEMLAEELVKMEADRVFFSFDSANLSNEAQMKLQKAAEYLKKYDAKVQQITIEGHADERGTREYNLALGDRRAVAVKRYLVGLGVDASKLRTISYGKERPAVDGHTEAVWSKNRRGVLVVR